MKFSKNNHFCSCNGTSKPIFVNVQTTLAKTQSQVFSLRFCVGWIMLQKQLFPSLPRNSGKLL